MKAAIYDGEGGISLQERTAPVANAGEALLATTRIGICGTDLNMISGSLGPIGGLQPGHEILARIEALETSADALRDDSSDALKTGQRVVVEPMESCGHCFHCHGGSYNRCAENRIRGVSATGGLAEYMTAPQNKLYPIDDAVPDAVAALTEPMTVCVRGARLGNIRLGDSVAIIGAGTIGLLSIRTALAAGAREVFVIARHAHQAALAQSLGATEVFSDRKAMLKGVGADSIDVVVETVGGSASTLIDATLLARRGGVICMLGVFEGLPQIPGIAFSTKELTMVASNCYSRGPRQADFSIGVNLIERDAALLAPLVTHEYSFDNVADAFRCAADKGTGSIKVQVAIR